MANIEGNAPALARISSTPHQARILLSLVVASELDSVLAAVIESLPTSLVGTPRARMTALDIFVNLVRAGRDASNGDASTGDARGGDASGRDADFPACWRAVCAIADQSDGSPQLLVGFPPSWCGVAFRPLGVVWLSALLLWCGALVVWASQGAACLLLWCGRHRASQGGACYCVHMSAPAIGHHCIALPAGRKHPTQNRKP